MYLYMTDVFTAWLKTVSMSAKEFGNRYSKAKKLDILPILNSGTITICLTDGRKSDVITSFPTTVILEDRKKYEREVGEAYIIGVIGEDIVFGQEKNPIRELEHTPGEIDGGLMTAINKLVPVGEPKS